MSHRIQRFRLPDFSLFVFFCLSAALFLAMPSRWLAVAVLDFLSLGNYKISPAAPPVSSSAPAGNGPFSDKNLSTGRERSGAEPAAEKKPRPVVFRLLAPAAQSVLLGGTFNNFDAGLNPLTRHPEGLWEITAALLPGRYQYKFKVDGEWQLDPTNPEKTPEPRSSSILDIQ